MRERRELISRSRQIARLLNAQIEARSPLVFPIHEHVVAWSASTGIINCCDKALQIKAAEADNKRRTGGSFLIL